MAKRKMWTMLALLAIVSLAWTAFVKPEYEKKKALAENGIETTYVAAQYQPESHGEPGFIDGLKQFWAFTGFRNATPGHRIMILIGLVFIFLAIRYEYEPLLLVPIGTGILIGNIPIFTDGGINLQVGIYQQGSVLNYLYFGVLKGVYPASYLPGYRRYDGFLVTYLQSQAPDARCCSPGRHIHHLHRGTPAWFSNARSRSHRNYRGC